MHPDLYMAQELAYRISGLHLTNIEKEKESAEYGAFDFDLNGKACKFRIGKITPKKIGFFFTIWKRLADGPIMPYDLADPIDFFVFSVRTDKQFGQFVFPKFVLFEKGVLSKDGNGGKRALRVYPPWVITKNKQAQKTQAWQGEYFFEISKNLVIDTSRVRSLFLQST